MEGLGGMLRSWGPGLKLVSGNFNIVSAAIGTTTPSRAGWTVARRAAGVYVVTLAKPFQSVVSVDAGMGQDTGIGTGALDTSVPLVVNMSANFQDASATNYVADTTNTKLLILCTTGGTLTELTANWRCRFDILLAESTVNK